MPTPGYHGCENGVFPCKECKLQVEAKTFTEMRKELAEANAKIAALRADLRQMSKDHLDETESMTERILALEKIREAARHASAPVQLPNEHWTALQSALAAYDRLNK